MKSIYTFHKPAVVFLILFALTVDGYCQYKDYELSPKGDTLNAIDNNNLKQGKWIITVAELRGEPGYEEEGILKDGKKEGTWRKYNSHGDLLATENYRFGGKDGLQQYFTNFGEMVREENWRAYNPDAPYDTIAVYGTGSNEIIDHKIVKAEQYSVRHGEWKFYDPSTGRIMKTETFDRNHLQKAPDLAEAIADNKPKKKVVPKEVLEFEKKNSGKKKVKLREGQTGL
jgi:hypothetical protein